MNESSLRVIAPLISISLGFSLDTEIDATRKAGALCEVSQDYQRIRNAFMKSAQRMTASRCHSPPLISFHQIVDHLGSLQIMDQTSLLPPICGRISSSATSPHAWLIDWWNYQISSSKYRWDSLFEF